MNLMLLSAGVHFQDSQDIINNVQNYEFPDFTVTNPFFNEWHFTTDAMRVSDFIRGFLNNCPDFVIAFVGLAFTFFTLGLFFRLLKQLL